MGEGQHWHVNLVCFAFVASLWQHQHEHTQFATSVIVCAVKWHFLGQLPQMYTLLIYVTFSLLRRVIH